MRYLMLILLAVSLTGCVNVSKESSAQVTPWECDRMSGPTTLCPNGH
jgi:PBP1b-binding outer membrane lipoprotein LpoB